MVLTWGTRAFCNKMPPCALDNDTISLLQTKKQGLVDGASFLNTSVGNERFQASCIQNLLEVWSYLDGHPTERISWLMIALGFSRFSHSKKLPNSLPGHGPWKRVGWGGSSGDEHSARRKSPNYRSSAPGRLPHAMPCCHFSYCFSVLL